MAELKYTDEQIIPVLKDPKFTSYRQVALKLGITPNGDFNIRCKDLCTKHSIPEKVQKNGRKGKAVLPKKKEGRKQVTPIDPGYQVPLPSPGTELLKFDDIQPGDKLLRNGKPIEVLGREKDKKLMANDKLIIKDRFSYNDKVTRKYFDDNPGKFTRNEVAPLAGDIEIAGQPIKDLPDSDKAKIVDKLKDDEAQFQADRSQEQKIKNVSETIFPGSRKPATVNEEFDALFRDNAPTEKSVEDLFASDPAVDAIESAPNNVEPVHIDLEMEDSADPVELRATNAEDYDPEWFDRPIPRKGTVERAIWDKAYQEIAEIQSLRATIQTALNQGKRIPNTYTDLYNRYVSKYSEEAGA